MRAATTLAAGDFHGAARTLGRSVINVAKAARKPADDMAVIVEDLIKMLDGVGNDLRRGRYPDKAVGEKYASVLRVVADALEG